MSFIKGLSFVRLMASCSFPYLIFFPFSVCIRGNTNKEDNKKTYLLNKPIPTTKTFTTQTIQNYNKKGVLKELKSYVGKNIKALSSFIFNAQPVLHNPTRKVYISVIHNTEMSKATTNNTTTTRIEVKSRKKTKKP